MRYVKAVIALLFVLSCVGMGGDALSSLMTPIAPAPEQVDEVESRSPYDYDLSEYLTMGDITAV